MNEEHAKKIREKTRYMPKGTPVGITCKGRTVEGIVISANNYFDRTTLKDDWYIEFADLNGEYSGYWKQGIDGGECDFPDDDRDWERQAGLNRGRP